jgi:hypothetical protein
MNPLIPAPNAPDPDVPPRLPRDEAAPPSVAPSPPDAAAAPPPAGDEYEPVEGLDRQTVELKRAYEAEVERKVSNDHVHIVLAYGVIWALFVVYGITLWLRHRRLERDLADLRRARGETR